MRQQIQLAEVEIIADLGTAAISLRDIVDMKVGDIIRSTFRKPSRPRSTACR